MSIQRRLYDCASIAGPYVDAGLSHEDADAHYALIHSKFDDIKRLVTSIPGWRELPFITLIIATIRREHTDLTNRAAVLQWTDRKAAYDADRQAWDEVKRTKGSAWRDLPMTAPQRFLIADTAQILSIEVPEGMNRGDAADWLEANGANVLTRLDAST